MKTIKKAPDGFMGKANRRLSYDAMMGVHHVDQSKEICADDAHFMNAIAYCG